MPIKLMIARGQQDHAPPIHGYSMALARRLPKERPDNRLEDRTFDPVLGIWKLTPKEIYDAAPEPRPLYRPHSDGSGVFWDIVCRATGNKMWTIEARTRRDALSEAIFCGHKAGYGRINVDVISLA